MNKFIIFLVFFCIVSELTQLDAKNVRKEKDVEGKEQQNTKVNLSDAEKEEYHDKDKKIEDSKKDRNIHKNISDEKFKLKQHEHDPSEGSNKSKGSDKSKVKKQKHGGKFEDSNESDGHKGSDMSKVKKQKHGGSFKDSNESDNHKGADKSKKLKHKRNTSAEDEYKGNVKFLADESKEFKDKNRETTTECPFSRKSTSTTTTTPEPTTTTTTTPEPTTTTCTTTTTTSRPTTTTTTPIPTTTPYTTTTTPRPTTTTRKPHKTCSCSSKKPTTPRTTTPIPTTTPTTTTTTTTTTPTPTTTTCTITTTTPEPTTTTTTTTTPEPTTTTTTTTTPKPTTTTAKPHKTCSCSAKSTTTPKPTTTTTTTPKPTKKKCSCSTTTPRPIKTTKKCGCKNKHKIIPQPDCGRNEERIFANCRPNCINNNTRLLNDNCAKCEVKCVCRTKYVRNRYGSCIPASHCSYCLEWNNHCPECPPTCDNPHPTGSCTRRTEAKYCCPRNKLLNSKGECVRIQDCDCSDKYAMFVLNLPRDHRASYQNPNPRKSHRIKSGCVCTNGTVFDENSKKCKPACNKCKCRPNSSFNTCGPSCEETCGFEDNEGKVCDKKCNAGCFCNPGYIRDENGYCIKYESCSRKFEYWDPCAHKVEPTCERPDRCIATWTCIEGYVRDKRNVCIRKQKCKS